MEITKQKEIIANLREIAKTQGMDYFAIAPQRRWKGAPEQHRPRDLLHQCESVIVMGKKIPEGALESNSLAYDRGERNGILAYMIFGYNKVNEFLNEVLFDMVYYLEDVEERTVYACPASTPRDEYAMMGVMSNRHSAVAAGIASFGWNGLAMTWDAGPRVRYCVLLTDIDFDESLYTPVQEPDSLCDRSKCRVCIDVCPVHAFPENDAWEFEIDGKKIRYAKLNRPRCRTGVTGLSAGSAGRMNAVIPDDVSKVEDWLNIAKYDNRWNRLERVASMCGRCMTTCPVGQTKIEPNVIDRMVRLQPMPEDGDEIKAK